MTTYYVKSGGSDGAAGTSDAAAWASISKVNGFAFSAGDVVQFRQVDTFTGQLYKGPWPANFTIRSYDPATGLPGSGRATIQNTTPSTVLGGGGSTAGLTVDSLELKTNEAVTGAGQHTIIASDSGSSCTNWLIRNCLIHQAGGSGILVNGLGTTGWVIDGCTISAVGDNGILFNHCGGGHEVKNNVIHDVGGFDALQGRHGIYAAAPNLLIHDNEFFNCPRGSAVSLREPGQVYNNRVHDTPYPFSFFDYSDTSTGKALWFENRCWNITGFGWYGDDTWSDNGRTGGTYGASLGTSGVDIVIANNTLLMANGSESALACYGRPHCNMTIANNVAVCLSGSTLYAVEGATPVAGKTWTEKNNLYFGFGSFRWNGSTYATLAAYQAAAAGGGGTVVKGLASIVADPALTAAPTLAPQPGSPVIDAGTTAVDAALTYQFV